MRRSTFGVALVTQEITIYSYAEIKFIATQKAVDIGPFKASKGESHVAQWPRVVSVVLILGGIGLTIGSRRRPV